MNYMMLVIFIFNKLFEQFSCFLDFLKPRYVRVNTLKTTLNQAVENFLNEGWTLVDNVDKNDYDGFIEKVNSLDEQSFLVDIHISNLLIFPPKTEFHNHPAYKKGSIILQDKVNN